MWETFGILFFNNNVATPFLFPTIVDESLSVTNKKNFNKRKNTFSEKGGKKGLKIWKVFDLVHFSKRAQKMTGSLKKCHFAALFAQR